jgi:hypothetical protein
LIFTAGRFGPEILFRYNDITEPLGN